MAVIWNIIIKIPGISINQNTNLTKIIGTGNSLGRFTGFFSMRGEEWTLKSR